jgi:hypothetical protein
MQWHKLQCSTTRSAGQVERVADEDFREAPTKTESQRTESLSGGEPLQVLLNGFANPMPDRDYF